MGRVSAVVLLAIVGACAVARADDAALARYHDEQARDAYAHGRYEDALEEFFFEQRLAPNPRIVFNIALCLDRLHRDDDAYFFYSEYVASDDDDAERRAFVTSAMATLEPRLARVRVESDPPGAVIYVDDRDHGAWGTTPRVLALAEGEHHITVERDGYASAESTVTVQRGQEQLARVTLTRLVGHLVVHAIESATLHVRDATGALVDEGPCPREVALPPGAYAIEVDADAFRPLRDVITIAVDDTRTIDAVLEALPPPSGEIAVTASVPGALITLDGEAVGFAPTIVPGLSVGSHHAAVHAEGLEPYEGEVDIEPDVRTWLTVSLEPPSRTVRSDATWIVGGIGLGGLAAWAVLLGLAVEEHDRFDTAVANHVDPFAAFDSARGLAIASDVVLGASLATIAASVVLYFATEGTETHASTGVTSRTER